MRDRTRRPLRLPVLPTALLLALAALVAPLGASQAGPLEPDEELLEQNLLNPFGVKALLSFTNYYDDVERLLALQQMRSLGIGWVTWAIQWSRVQPTAHGPFDFEKADAIVAEPPAFGIHQVITLTTTPAWAANAPPGETTHNYPPWNAADYGAFVYATVSRYNGDFAYANPPSTENLLDVKDSFKVTLAPGRCDRVFWFNYRDPPGCPCTLGVGPCCSGLVDDAFVPKTRYHDLAQLIDTARNKCGADFSGCP